MMARLTLVLALAVMAVGCAAQDGEPDPPVDEPTPNELAPDAGDPATALPFLSACDLTQDECDKTSSPELLCFGFNMKGAHCTHPCVMDTDCGDPSPGCNGKGVCKVP
jgi:hypothetical protein